MSKKYKNRLCAYCGEIISSTGDHVFAREFFLPDERNNLPQVPSCMSCNARKSKLEHYLTAVLPFGARHKSAERNLKEMVPKRLAANIKLRTSLRENWGSLWAEEEGTVTRVSTLPLDVENVEELFTYVVKGLTLFHFNVYLTHEHDVKIMVLTNAGQEFFEHLFSLNARGRVNNNLGNGTFVYEGSQAVDLPEITVWRFQVYGGLKFGDDEFPREAATFIGALTGPSLGL